jgi:hypothetical protein
MAPDTVPKPLQIAILQMTGDLYETRTTQLLTERAAFADSGNMFKRLVAPYRLART